MKPIYMKNVSIDMKVTAMQEEKKKDSSYLTTNGSPFEYNRFTRNYFANTKNKGKIKKM